MAEKIELILDSPDIYTQYDPQGMLSHLHAFPENCLRAWKLAQAFKLPDNFSDVDKVLVLGMGGSAIGGDLASGLVLQGSRVPILVCRDYTLPGYVDARTLVIASSYSGMTEETLSAFRQALDRPAKKMAVTTGGDLKKICLERDIPVLTIDYKAQPRAALPYSFFILLGLLQQAGLIENFSKDVEATVRNLTLMASRINEKAPYSQNLAKITAGKLAGRLPVIYGAGITTEAAHRWKTQINENGKTSAFYEFLSELNHNSVVGYPLPEEFKRDALVIFLDSPLLHQRIKLRFEITRTLLDQAGIPYHLVSGEGATALSQMMTLVLLGDYVSYYLAVLNKVDPSPVKSIDFLKKSLAGS